MSTPDSLNELVSDFVIPLTGSSVIAVEGEQQNDYLHGQLTINVKNLADNTARHAAHCDFKGKTWSLSTVCRWQNSILMLMPSGCAEASLEQLKKYGVFSKVTIEKKDSQLKQYAVKGKQAEQWISEFFGSLPEQKLATVQHSDGVAIRADYPQDVFILLLSETAAGTLEQWQADQNIQTYNSCVYDALMVSQGIPEVSGEVVNEFVPQMMNVQALDGIDFNKGCYMGQEVVARTRYLGKNKRAGYVFCLPAAIDVKVGDTVEKALDTGWRRGGTVIRCATLGKETWFMAVLPNDTEADTPHRLADAPDVQACFYALPYTV
ncbi:MAG: glycine cleavage system protein T [Alteromonadaceae bacterium]|nr:glycine cleavage system protein T [Alteromonadaceae bacterium]